MIDQADRSGLLALLAWYREMGADCALDEAPIDWLARGDTPPGHGLAFRPRREPEAGSAAAADKPAPRSPPAIAPRVSAPARPAVSPPAAAGPTRRFPTAAPDAAETAARTAAKAAKTIPELAAAIDRFEGCGLKATAKHTCVWRGAEKARIMIVGEAPGREEDLEGKPFVGRAGQLLDRMLAAIGLGEADVHITNIVYWRPPGNRTPTPPEAQVCRPFLERQAELVAPEIVVLLGGAAAKHLLDDAEGIMRLRGKWRELALGGHRARAIATLHPAYLLRTPAAKRLAWLDLIAVRTALDAVS
jgi:DNA polymerase